MDLPYKRLKENLEQMDSHYSEFQTWWLLSTQFILRVM